MKKLYLVRAAKSVTLDLFFDPAKHITQDNDKIEHIVGDEFFELVSAEESAIKAMLAEEPYLQATFLPPEVLVHLLTY